MLDGYGSQARCSIRGRLLRLWTALLRLLFSWLLEGTACIAASPKCDYCYVGQQWAACSTWLLVSAEVKRKMEHACNAPIGYRSLYMCKLLAEVDGGWCILGLANVCTGCWMCSCCVYCSVLGAGAAAMIVPLLSFKQGGAAVRVRM